MSIDQSGLSGKKVHAGSVTIEVQKEHPLLSLADGINWENLAEIVLPDLKHTKKGKWWMGRPLRLRVHLGAYLLQQLHNLTDRETEYALKDNAAFRLFCGEFIVKKFHAPDHTKIEAFRSKLSPETQKQLANALVTQAVDLGFAQCEHLDIDSTVQEANLRYPTDNNLLCKLGYLAKRGADYMNERLLCFSIKPMRVNLSGIKSVARRYFFMNKTAPKEEKTKTGVSHFVDLARSHDHFDAISNSVFNHFPVLLI